MTAQSEPSSSGPLRSIALFSLLQANTSFLLSNYSGCLSVVGTPEFATDPGCNTSLAYEAQAALPPHMAEVTRWSVNDDAVYAHCRTPACTSELLAANIAGLSSLSAVGCQAKEFETTADPRLAVSTMAQCHDSLPP